MADTFENEFQAHRGEMRTAPGLEADNRRLELAQCAIYNLFGFQIMNSTRQFKRTVEKSTYIKGCKNVAVKENSKITAFCKKTKQKTYNHNIFNKFDISTHLLYKHVCNIVLYVLCISVQSIFFNWLTKWTHRWFRNRPFPLSHCAQLYWLTDSAMHAQPIIGECV